MGETMKRCLQFLLASCVAATLAACSAPGAGTTAEPSGPATMVAATPTSPAAVPSQDVRSLDWSVVELPVSALEPALAPTGAADGTTSGLLCASPSDWSGSVPSGWVTFKDSQALVPDTERKPSDVVPKPGWWMRLLEPVFGQLGDGRQIAAVPMGCGPTDGNGSSNLLLVFDAVGGTPARPHLIGIYQPTGTFQSRDLAITDGHIGVAWRTLGPHDPRANPTVKHSGTIDLTDGRLVPSWPDVKGLRATLWEESPGGATSSPSPSVTTAPTPPSTEPVDLARVDWKSFTLPAEPLAAGLARLHCGPSLSALKAAFPDGRVPFSYQPPRQGLTYSAAVAAFIPDPSVKAPGSAPGKAGWLLLLSHPTLGTLNGGTAVAAFSMLCLGTFPGDGWPDTLVVVDGTGGGPNPLGIYNAGQYVTSIAVAQGQVVAEVGDNGPWQGKITVSNADAGLEVSLKPDKGYKAADAWNNVELWTRS